MEFTFNGIGTMFCGQRDFQTDGSFTTTEWIVFLYVPLIPLRSLRVQHKGPAETRFPIGFSSAESYAIHERTFPNWRQVICVYCFTVSVAAWVLLLGSSYMRIARSVGDTVANIGLFVALVVPSLIPVGLRLYAKRKLRR